jgi:[ribosomal protein S18]-alanine N-acetyltransferase
VTGAEPPPSPTHRIRRCTDGDLDAILGIENESFSDPYDRDTFSQLLRSEPEGFLVAEGDDDDDGDILGYVASSARYGLILSLAVSADHRREGIGTMMMDAALRYLRGRARRVTLQVRVSNAPAISLYRRFSFREAGKVRRYYPDGEDALVMTLDLRQT